mgnify:CR=1 FL=1
MMKHVAHMILARNPLVGVGRAPRTLPTCSGVLPPSATPATHVPNCGLIHDPGIRSWCLAEQQTAADLSESEAQKAHWEEVAAEQQAQRWALQADIPNHERRLAVAQAAIDQAHGRIKEVEADNAENARRLRDFADLLATLAVVRQVVGAGVFAACLYCRSWKNRERLPSSKSAMTCL